MDRCSYLLVSQFERLEEWCRNVRIIFGSAPYLVGSALERPDFRDVDLRIIMDDEEFDGRFQKPIQVRLLNRAISIWGQQETGLPVDFQIQRMTEANAKFNGQRNSMGFRNWNHIPTSGVQAGEPLEDRAGKE